jgi:hypothetical protein
MLPQRGRLFAPARASAGSGKRGSCRRPARFARLRALHYIPRALKPRVVPLAAVALATLLGGVLRLSGLGTPGLWLDEILHYDIASRAAGNPWHSWLLGFEFENGPLFYGSLLAGRVAPGAETSDRLAEAIAGTATIPLIAIAGAMAAGTGAGVAAAWLLAVAPLHVFYSREGRPYALLALLATLLLIAFLARSRRTARLLGWGSALAAPYLAVSAFQVLAGGLLATVACGAVQRVEQALRVRRAVRWARWRPGGVDAGGDREALPTGVEHEVRDAGAAPAAREGIGEREVPDAGAGRDAPEPAGEAIAGLWGTLALAALAGLVLLALLYGRYPRGPQFGPFPAAHGRLLGFILNALAAWPFWPAPLAPPAPWFAVAAVAGLAALAPRRPRTATALGALAIATAGAAWAGMALPNHFFTLRYFTPVLPSFLVLVAAGTAGAARGLGWVVARLQGSPASPAFAPLLAGAAVATLVVCNLGTAVACPYQKADWRAAARAIAIDGQGPGTVLAANHWSAYSIGFYLRRERGRIAVAELDAAPRPAVAAAAARGGCWLVHGGYPQRPALKRWMRNFPAIWHGRDESIAVFRCTGSGELPGLEPGEAPGKDFPPHPPGSFSGTR